MAEAAKPSAEQDALSLFFETLDNTAEGNQALQQRFIQSQTDPDAEKIRVWWQKRQPAAEKE